MPEIRTDDGPRKLRAVWLGPAGSTLPFEWTYVQWSVVLACLPVGMLLTWLVAYCLGIPPFMRNAIGFLWGGAGGVYLGVKVMKGVSFDEPLRFRKTVAVSELDPRHRHRLAETETWELDMPRFRELSPTAAQHLGLQPAPTAPEEDQK